jgi:hypothetical protein
LIYPVVHFAVKVEMKFPGYLSWWIVIPNYALCGLALGLADAQLGQLFRQYGLAVVYPQGHEWVAARLLRAVPPVLVAACLGYAILGNMAALFTRIAWK